MRTIQATAFTLLLVLALCATGAAQTARVNLDRVKVDIKSQPMRLALKDLGEQTGLQIMFRAEDVAKEGMTAPRISGELSATEALERMLARTGLRYRFVNPHTVLISAMDGAVAEKTALMSELSPIYLAQVDGPMASSAASPEASQGSGTEKRTAPQGNLEEVVVTGTHIRGLASSTLPVRILDRNYIDSTGVTSAAALMASVPQNFSLNNQSGLYVPGTTSSAEQGASINLRGIGEGTTLVLLNGHRLAPGFFGSAVDISALPLAAIDRVEILTDGASALYGSDAVGGVVNFVLRKDFTGAETQVRYGSAKGGLDEFRASQLAGHSWGSGNALVTLDYYKRDLLPASQRDFVPVQSHVGSLLPRDKNWAAMISGRQTLTDRTAVFVDALYTKRDSFNLGGLTAPFNEQNSIENPQTSATAGLDWGIAGDWRLEASGNYSQNKMERTYSRTGLFVSYDIRYAIRAGELKADGPLLQLPAGSMKGAIGVDWREESLNFHTAGFNPTHTSLDQTVRSAFAELSIPVVSPEQSFAIARRLEFSLASRRDDYSSFGSSLDPQVGAMWEPAAGLRIRGTYGSSFKAPRLVDYDVSQNGALAIAGLTDPGAPTGKSNQLFVTGFAADEYSAQRSRSLSVGVDIQPTSVPELTLSVDYYRIRYRDMIAQPPDSLVILGNPSSFAGLFIRNPTLAQVNHYISIGELGIQPFTAYNSNFSINQNFDPSTIEVIVDRRTRNLSRVRTSGLDLSTMYALAAGLNKLNFGLDGTYIFNREQQVTDQSATFDTVATVYNPPHLRLRGSLGWRRTGWSGNVFINYTGSYTDKRTATLAGVSPYTVVDARVAYEFGSHAFQGVLSGVTVSATAQNLFDRDPPAIAANGPRDLGFDPTNASPLGRLLAIELRKAW